MVDQASNLESSKSADFTASYTFQPGAAKNLGPNNYQSHNFLNNLCQRICIVSGDDREALLLLQRISVSIQRFNSAFLHDSFCIDCPDQ